MNLQKAGAIAAVIQALAYVIGFAALALVFDPSPAGANTPVEKLAFLLDRKALFQLWSIGIYVVFGIALVVLALALHERIKAKAQNLVQVATAFGLIWSGLVIASGMIASVGIAMVARLHAIDATQATLAWQILSTVQDGLGGGVEVVGGIWLLLISIAGLRTKQLSKALNWLGVVIGTAGLLTLAPPLSDLGAVFGLGQIIWFSGIALVLRKSLDPDNSITN